MAEQFRSADPATVESMSMILQDAAESDELIDSIGTLDRTGIVVASSDRSSIGRDIAAIDETWTGPPSPSGGGEVRFDIGPDSVRLAVAAPMVLDGQHLGTAVLRLADGATDPLLATTRFGRTGEVVLGYHDESADGPRFLTPLRRADSNGFVLSNRGDIPMASAMDGGSVVFDGASDYAGAPVIAVTRPLPELGWGLVAKVDRSEVAGEVTPIRDGFLALGAGLILFGISAGLMYGRRLETETVSRSRAEDRFTSTFASAPVALLVVDTDGLVQQANRCAGELLGFRPPDLRGVPIDRLVPADETKHKISWADVINDGDTREVLSGHDATARTADNTDVPVEVGVTPIETDDGVMLVASLVDLSERKEAERLMTERAAALERSNRDLDDFAYVASHDLKAPMRAIESLAGFVLEDVGDALPESSQRDLEEIQQRSSLLTELLRGLLDYARIGREEAEPVTIDVAEMIDRLTELYVPLDRFDLHVDNDLPPLVAPQAAAELVFRNLLMNAVDHHDQPTGSIWVSGWVEDGMACFAVEDDGPGIPEAHRERVFQIFKTVDRPNSRGSTGMGLTLIKRTVEAHGGSVQITERPPSTGAVHTERPPSTGAVHTERPPSTGAVLIVSFPLTDDRSATAIPEPLPTRGERSPAYAVQ